MKKKRKTENMIEGSRLYYPLEGGDTGGAAGEAARQERESPRVKLKN
jgi:hypothetical protein